MHSKTQSYRSDLGRVRGLGSAKEGTHHWWMMKITSVALIPLSIWFVCSMVSLLGADLATLQAWLKQPVHAIVMMLFIGFALHHGANGLQTVFEDYVHCPVAKTVLLIGNKLFHLVLAVTAFLSIIIIALKA